MIKLQEKVEVHSICQIPSINISCWGCCGRNYKSKKEIEKQIKKNTLEFLKIKIPSTLRLLEFRDRFSEDRWAVPTSGICSNLVKFKNGIYACPLHKHINKLVNKKDFLAIHKKDLRWGHCDVNFECETVKIFSKFSQEKKAKYIQWISKQHFDHYTYSIGNIECTNIKKFLKEIEKQKQ